MTHRRTLVLLAAALAAAIALATPAHADVYYEVGPGQTYATIGAAISAIPAAAFTQSHIVNIHAGLYVETIDTDPGAYRGYQPTPTNRLVIQANPGDDVTVQLPAPTMWATHTIRDSNVTIQGLKFTGQSDAANYAYLRFQYSHDGPRKGYLLYNNEFVNSPAYAATFGGNDADWNIAYVNNYSHSSDFHSDVAAVDVAAGNVFGGMKTGATGGGSFISLAATGQAVNNTIVGAKIGVRNDNKTAPVEGSLIANNIIVDAPTTPMYFSALLKYTTTPDYVPAMSNNLQYDNPEWATSQHVYPTLANWNATLAAAGRPTEDGSLEGVDPLFVNAAGNDYRLQELSQAATAGDPDAWDEAIATIPGLDALLAGYWNSARDLGYDRGQSNVIGALVALQPDEADAIPEPASAVLVILGAAAVIRRRRRRQA